MEINIDFNQFECLKQYIEDQNVIYDNKDIIIEINGAPWEHSIKLKVIVEDI